MKPLPCPFCGSESKVIEKHSIGGRGSLDIVHYDVKCTNSECYLSEGAGWVFDTEEEAVELWNKRPLREKKLKRILK